MKLARTRPAKTAALALAGALALTVAACTPSNEGGNGGNGDPTDSNGDTGEEVVEGLSGDLVGVGASAQGAAQEAWIVGFQNTNPDVSIAYDGGGSGAGREGIIQGGVDYAGSDRAFHLDELPEGGFSGHAKAADGATIVELPIYISPIVVGFNLEGIDTLNLDAETIAHIFAGDITNWNDEAIAAHNEGVELPDQAITVVYRSTNSGTTENFTDYLSAVAPEAWPHEPSGDWPEALTGGEAVAETADMAGALGNPGTIGYIDASGASGISSVALQVGDEYVPFSPEAAAAVVDDSELAEGREATDLAIEINRTTEAAGAYPLVLISYAITYSEFNDPAQAELVREYLKYAASAEGQDAAAQNAGSAPISDDLRTQVLEAIDSIQ